ncbi:MAG: type II toxin-antitoxin system HicB family antitoxin [Gammaproteobacteria bacterium]|nr:type II toxin-antitoxin system HicB family antitoxin [Gammaproteobacteria bacterium]
MQLTAILTPALERGFVAMNPETGTHTQGESVDEALTNLQKATELYLEGFPMAIHKKSWLTTIEIPSYAS